MLPEERASACLVPPPPFARAERVLVSRPMAAAHKPIIHPMKLTPEQRIRATALLQTLKSAFEGDPHTGRPYLEIVDKALEAIKTFSNEILLKGFDPYAGLNLPPDIDKPPSEVTLDDLLAE